MSPTNANMKDYTFVANLRLDEDGTPLSWDNIPDTYWSLFLWGLPQLEIDGIGFQDVTEAAGITKLKQIATDSFKFLEVATYPAFHGETRTKEIGVFDLQTSEIQGLVNVSFEEWGKDNPDLPIDELAFFEKGVCKIVVVPYEDLILLYGITDEELEVLKKVDIKYQECFHEMVNGKFKV